MQPIVPVNYKIQLEPDLVNFSFSGKCEFLFQASKPVAEVSLNILEIAIWSCRIWQSDHWVDCAFKIDPENEAVIIYLPEPGSGNIKLEIDYQGLINDKMAGFYRSQYTDQGQSRYIAVTQFEESDARRAFPCIDHPAAKASFDITMDIDKHLVAISNETIKNEEVLANGKSALDSRKPQNVNLPGVFRRR